MKECCRCYYKNNKKSIEPCVSCKQYEYEWNHCEINPFDNEDKFDMYVQEKKPYKQLSVEEKIKLIFGR